MARRKRTPEENERRAKIRELLQMANIGSMDGIQSLFKETIAEFMQNGLDKIIISSVTMISPSSFRVSHYLTVRSVGTHTISCPQFGIHTFQLSREWVSHNYICPVYGVHFKLHLEPYNYSSNLLIILEKLKGSAEWVHFFRLHRLL